MFERRNHAMPQEDTKKPGVAQRSYALADPGVQHPAANVQADGDHIGCDPPGDLACYNRGVLVGVTAAIGTTAPPELLGPADAGGAG